MFGYVVRHLITLCSLARSSVNPTGADWWEGHGEVSVPPLPPDSVLDSVLHDLLSPPRPAAMGGGGSLTAAAAGGSGDGQQPGTASSSNTGGSGGDACLRRSAPAGSLLCRLSLHALVFGNARAVAALWQRFMVQVNGGSERVSRTNVWRWRASRAAPLCSHANKAWVCLLVLLLM
jgi:hypothetical protein